MSSPSTQTPGRKEDLTPGLTEDSTTGLKEDSTTGLKEDSATTTPMANLPDLPVEVFGQIATLVTHHDLRSLRLVNQQCEAKVSAYYFREVVVQVLRFRPKPSATPGDRQTIDAINGNAGASKNARTVTATASEIHTYQNTYQDMYQDMYHNVLSQGGGRILEQLGHLVTRFALSLDFDENALACPRPKIKEEVIRSFWGLYRWPRSGYTRFEDLHAFENSADRHENMKAAMRCLTNVTSLGLRSDVGWGFLCGPDRQARNHAIQQRVFINQTNGGATKWLDPNPSSAVTVSEALRSPLRHRNLYPRARNRNELILKEMLKNAGFLEGQMEEAISLLLKSEGKSSVSDMDLEASHGSPMRAKISMIPALWLPASASQQLRQLEKNSVLPTALRRVQIEMLFELELAYRAWTQSYILSAIDCSKEGCFQNLTTLNIAKIPSSHLHILGRHDLWDAFPSLKNVSLGVVADWRRIEVHLPGWPTDEAVSPVDAVPLAHSLINDYIGACSKIESFHFEWICGGELASSCHQRGRYVLPAPFYAEPARMCQTTVASVGEDPELLRLPHVKHLSLKNCWVAPHVLIQSLRGYSLKSLESVEFEGVSLSTTPLNDTTRRMPELWNWNLQPMTSSLSKVRLPPWMSWAGLIEHFSPSVKLRTTINGPNGANKQQLAEYQRDTLQNLKTIIPDAAQLPSEEALYKLRSLTFKSCGYVDVKHGAFSNLDILTTPHDDGLLPPNITLMQHCADPLLGQIINYEMPNDKVPFCVFNFRIKPVGDYHKKIIDAATADSYGYFGSGRFSGALRRSV